MKTDYLLLDSEEKDHELLRMAEAIERVRELHSKSEFGTCEFCIAGYLKPYPYNYKYPCPTIRALEEHP